MTSLNQLDGRIRDIELRNLRVEEDKTWETSLTRKILLIIFTWISIGLYLRAIGIDRPWLNAIVPALGFYLSTLTLPFFKSLWQKSRKKRG
jgi:hypothetical protein